MMAVSCFTLVEHVPVNTGKPISILPTMADTTKAPLTGTDFPDIAFMLASSFSQDGETFMTYFPEAIFEKSGDTWTASPEKYWPYNSVTSFLAYAAPGLSVKATWNENAASGFILAGNEDATTIPDNRTIQSDIMYAGIGNQTRSSGSINMSFKHAQSLLRFTGQAYTTYDASANTGVTIESITMSSLKYQGKLTATLTGTTISAAWTLLPTTGSATVATGSFGLPETGTVDLGQGYLVLPQDPVEITIGYTMHHGATNVSKTYSFTPEVGWEMGYSYTYAIFIDLDAVIVEATVNMTPWNVTNISRQAGVNHILITGDKVDSYSDAYDFSFLSEMYWRPDEDSEYELLTPVVGHYGSSYDFLRQDGGYLTLIYDGIHHYVDLWTLETQALTIVMREAGKVSLSYSGVAEMSINGGPWETYSPVNAVAGDRIRYRCLPGTSKCAVSVKAPFDVEGNILSLMDTRFVDVKALNMFSEGSQLSNLFNGQPVVDASRLVMPSFTATGCFDSMFENCSRLIKAPQLPARTLAESCYEDMFKGCTSLTESPRLEADILKYRCYFQMFQGCRNLNYIEMTATDISATYALNNWVSNVASTGTFVKDPSTEIPINNNSGIPVGWTDMSLGHLTILPSSTGFLTYTGTNPLFWSHDGVTWTEYSSPVTVNYGDRIVLKGESESWEGCHISCTAPYKILGDIMSLVAGDDFSTATISAENAFAGLFSGSDLMNDASALILPSTLTPGCFNGMFSGCEDLAAPPQLPATVLAEGCYQDMFRGCSMLPIAPELPAETLVEDCYAGMFYDCVRLSTIIMYATDYSAEGALSEWVHNVAETGGFTAPAATYAGLPDGDDGVPTGWRDGGMTDTPFTIVTREAGTLYINVLVPNSEASFNAGINVECRINDGEWTGVQNVFTWVNKITNVNAGYYRCSTDLLAGDEISFRTTVDRRSSAGSGYGEHWYAGNRTSTFDYSGTFDVKGNIASLVCSGDFGARGATYNQTISFTNFLKETKVVDASKLILPFLTMYDTNEYKSFFHDCAQLLKAPQTLPAMTLKGTCYRNFCLGCSLLVEGPRIMATTRNGNNFQQMFYDCASLKSVYCMISSWNSNAFTNWMYGVPAGGTIILNAAIAMPSGAGGIPSGWTAKYIVP